MKGSCTNKSAILWDQNFHFFFLVLGKATIPNTSSKNDRNLEKLLLAKLKDEGFSGKSLKWMQNHLCHRFKKTQVNVSSSDWIIGRGTSKFYFNSAAIIHF